jgi:ribosomal protein S18 acetylase RimI-like enzyme
VDAGAARRATIGEAAAVAEVYLRSFHAGLPTISLAHTDDEVREWFRAVVVPTKESWVWDDDGAVVAMMVLGDGWIEHLYVDPEHQRAGIGSSLVALAKERQPSGLRLYAFQVNEVACRFYEKHGFVELERGDGSGNEEGEPDVLYEWTGLSSPA